MTGEGRGGSTRDVQRWKIGDVTIHKVVELEIPGKATWILPEATPENLRDVEWCRPHFVTPDGEAILSVHALLIESQGQRIVVDTCIGNDKNLPGLRLWHRKTGGTFLADLAAAGFPADRIDTVLCTHPPRRSRRLEHGSRGRPLAADLPQRPAPVEPRGVRVLVDRGGHPGRRLRGVGRPRVRCRPGGPGGRRPRRHGRGAARADAGPHAGPRQRCTSSRVARRP